MAIFLGKCLGKQCGKTIGTGKNAYEESLSTLHTYINVYMKNFAYTKGKAHSSRSCFIVWAASCVTEGPQVF